MLTMEICQVLIWIWSLFDTGGASGENKEAFVFKRGDTKKARSCRPGLLESSSHQIQVNLRTDRATRRSIRIVPCAGSSTSFVNHTRPGTVSLSLKDDFSTFNGCTSILTKSSRDRACTASASEVKREAVCGGKQIRTSETNCGSVARRSFSSHQLLFCRSFQRR